MTKGDVCITAIWVMGRSIKWLGGDVERPETRVECEPAIRGKSLSARLQWGRATMGGGAYAICVIVGPEIESPEKWWWR